MVRATRQVKRVTVAAARAYEDDRCLGIRRERALDRWRRVYDGIEVGPEPTPGECHANQSQTSECQGDAPASRIPTREARRCRWQAHADQSIVTVAVEERNHQSPGGTRITAGHSEGDGQAAEGSVTTRASRTVCLPRPERC
jgi:hypothetical protein